MDHSWFSIFAVEHTTYRILPPVKILTNNTQSMRCETSAHYDISQRPPLNWR